MNSIAKPTVDASVAPFDPLRASRIALLTTFHRNGQAVATPVEIRVVDGKGYFHTWSSSGKIKRIANNPRVTFAPCTTHGDVIGPAVEGIALQLEGVEAAHAASKIGGKGKEALIGEKYPSFMGVAVGRI
jgi:uncharacterized protein